jgi:hypothetical protein
MTTANTVAANTIVINKPTGTVPGDVLVASIAVNGASTPTAPSGWIQIAAVTGASNPRLYSYYRVAGSGEPTIYTWTLSAAVANSGGIARYSGVNNATPLDSAATQASSATAVSSLAVPAVTTVTNGAMLVGAAAINSSNETITITSPTGMTQRWDLGGKRQDYADVLQATAGSSGSKTWTWPAGSMREAAGWLAALRPQ